MVDRSLQIPFALIRKQRSTGRCDRWQQRFRRSVIMPQFGKIPLSRNLKKRYSA